MMNFEVAGTLPTKCIMPTSKKQLNFYERITQTNCMYVCMCGRVLSSVSYHTQENFIKGGKI